MKYEAKVLELDNQIEESVLLDVQGKNLTCFASFCPYKIEVGEVYPVEFNIRIFDDINVEKVEEGHSDCINLIDGFRYSIIGTLREGTLVAMGLTFMEDDDFSDINYLEGQSVKIEVDRLDVHFCE